MMSQGKRIYIILFYMVLQTTVLHAQPKNIVLKTLSNYFLSDKAGLKNKITCKVITKEKEFDKTFGIAKTMTNKIDRPDFTTQQVVMIALQPTNKEAKIKILSALHAGNFVEVYFTTSKERFPLPYTTLPLAVATIPKYKEVTLVRFYEDKRLVEEVSLK